MGWRGWAPGGGDTKRKLYLRKNNFFVIEKYIEDAKQKENRQIADRAQNNTLPWRVINNNLRQTPIFFRTNFAVTLLLQDKWASLSLPADPGRLFPPVWRPQYILKVSFS